MMPEDEREHKVGSNAVLEPPTLDLSVLIMFSYDLQDFAFFAMVAFAGEPARLPLTTGGLPSTDCVSGHARGDERLTLLPAVPGSIDALSIRIRAYFRVHIRRW